jgi:hypothetical protein
MIFFERLEQIRPGKVTRINFFLGDKSITDSPFS